MQKNKIRVEKHLVFFIYFYLTMKIEVNCTKKEWQLAKECIFTNPTVFY